MSMSLVFPQTQNVGSVLHCSKIFSEVFLPAAQGALDELLESYRAGLPEMGSVLGLAVRYWTKPSWVWNLLGVTVTVLHQWDIDTPEIELMEILSELPKA